MAQHVQKMRPRRHLETDVYTLALERAAYVLDSFDHVAVAFSGGKDSTATLNVALEAAHSDPRFERHLPLRAIFFDEEAIPFETEEYVRRTGQRDDVALEWYCLPVQHRNACSRRSPYWWPWAPEAEADWCRPLPPEALTTLEGFPVWPPEARMSIPNSNGLFFPPALGNCAMMLGIRAQESMRRMQILTMASKGRDQQWVVPYGADSAHSHTSRGNLWKAYPVYDWKTEDVWTAPALKGWDYNHAYDRYEMAGIAHSNQRCSPAFGEEPILGLSNWAQCFPEVWAKMVGRVPGVGAAVRYAKTELYGFGHRPEKPDGMTWPDFIVHYLAKHDPKAVAQVANRVRTFTKTHYKKTADPIAGLAPHPLTGVSWDFLLMIAMRGDFKERKSSTTKVQSTNQAVDEPEVKAREWRRYAEELAGELAAGTFADLAYPGRIPADPYTLIPAEYAALLEARP
jgi:predicted phosphoadenosine phosphosulfate sulfurtransferase